MSSVAGALRRHPQFTRDYGVSSEDFGADRAEIIRASLTKRLGRCALTVCLLGEETLRDDWVLWSLETAHRLGIPTVASALTAGPSPDARRVFAFLGAGIVPLDATAITRHVPRVPPRERPRDGLDPGLLLHMMRHPLR